MINDKNEPPCKIEDVLTFNFENLRKFLSFLHQGEVDLTTKIKNLNSKISEVDNFKIRMEEAEFKLNLFQNKFKEVDTTQYAHQHKLIELDARQISNLNHLIQHDGILNEICPKTKTNEENINDQKKISEENTKAIRRLLDTTEDIKLQQDRSKIELEKFKLNLDKKSKESETTQEKKYAEISENFNKINKKLESTEDSLLKMVAITTRKFDHANNSDGSRAAGVSNINIQNLLPDENNFHTVMSHVNSILTQIDFLKEENNSRKESIQNSDKARDLLEENLNNNIKNFKLQTSQSNNLLDYEDFYRREKSLIPRNSFNSYEQQSKILKNMLATDDDEDIMTDNVEKLNDNLKFVSQTINNRVTKEDLERLNKIFRLEIEKNNEKFANQLKIMEGKLRAQSTNQVERKNSSDNKSDKNFMLQIHELIARMSKEIIDKEILSVNLSQKELFQDSSNKIDMIKSELNKNFQSVLEIKKSFLQSKQPLDDTMRESNSRVLELEILAKNQKIQIDEIMWIIEGDSYDSSSANFTETKNETSNTSIRDLIKHLNSNVKVLTDKIEQIQIKQSNMNTEILTKVKKDLQYESGRILEDFNFDLKNSINKIQEQLKEKVDRLNLDEFGRKIDNKMLIEIGKKLDKNDLKKNTNLINKKIDTLENKISKTLVDTLIDLQNDEAPLIVKKSINGEKCASCNQYVQNSQHMHSNTYENINLTKSLNNMRYRQASRGNLEDSVDDTRSVRVSQLPEISTMSKAKSHFNIATKR